VSGISNDKIYEALLGLREDVGSLKNGQANSIAYIGAVSKKADDIRKDLDEHKLKENAHGAGASRRVWTEILAWAAVGLAAIEIILGIKSRH
jgi:hypothetical protein